MRATYNAKTRVWSLPADTPLFNPRANLGQILISCLDLTRDRICQVDAATGAKVTAGEVRTRAIRAAQNLKGLGYAEGDVFAIAARTLEDVPAILVAGLLMGAPVNTLDPDFSTAEFSNMLGQTRPKVIFCESQNAARIKKSLCELKLCARLYTFDGKVPDAWLVRELFRKNSSELAFESPRIEDPDSYVGVITCSSGTTGASKGVVMTHKGLIDQLTTEKTAPDETLYQPGSLYWVSVVLGVLNSMSRGATRIVDPNPFDPERALQIIDRHNVRVAFVSPTRLSRMMQVPNIRKYDLTKLLFIFSVGSLFGETLKKQVRQFLPRTTPISFYGLSETISAVAMSVAKVGHENAVGFILPGCQVKIIDDKGRAVGNTEQGEILVKRHEMFLGYFNAPDKTREAVDKHGWLHTGDVGYFDEYGCLYIVDRIKDIILYRNMWVVPGAIEDRIMGLEGVQQVVVVGIPHEVDVEWPAAVVVKTPGSKVTSEDVKKVVEDNFAETKRLRGGVWFVDKIPETATGKFKRREAKRMAIEMFKNAQEINFHM